MVHGQVTRRDDDPFGQGFGYVKTGFVSSQKLSFLQRSSSVDRSDPRMFLGGADSAQSNDSRGRGLRVTWAESPNGSRPGSNMGWVDKVVEMDAQALRAQTPPLAGEWAVSKGSEVKSFNQSSASFASSNSSFNAANGISNVANGNNIVANGNSIVANGNSINANGNRNAAIMSSNNVSGYQSNQLSAQKTSQMSMHKSSVSTQESMQKSSAFSSNTNSTFKSSSSFQSSSNFQSGIKSQTFEAFPGMGGIENLNLEVEKAGN